MTKAMAKKIGIISGVVAVVAVVLFMVFRPRPLHPVELGERAPNFVLPGVERAPVNLSIYRGKVVLINFWATWCPPCIAETPTLEQLASKLSARDVAVIGVSVNEHEAPVETFIKQYHLTYPIARDPGGKLAARYGTYKFPETYILDRNGRLAAKIISNTDWVDPHMVLFLQDLVSGSSRVSLDPSAASRSASASRKNW